MEIGGDAHRATPTEYDDRTTADGKTSSVHWLRFKLTPEQIARFQQRARRAGHRAPELRPYGGAERRDARRAGEGFRLSLVLVARRVIGRGQDADRRQSRHCPAAPQAIRRSDKSHSLVAVGARQAQRPPRFQQRVVDAGPALGEFGRHHIFQQLAGLVAEDFAPDRSLAGAYGSRICRARPTTRSSTATCRTNGFSRPDIEILAARQGPASYPPWRATASASSRNSALIEGQGLVDADAPARSLYPVLQSGNRIARIRHRMLHGDSNRL